jgi:hypothetical protein
MQPSVVKIKTRGDLVMPCDHLLLSDLFTMPTEALVDSLASKAVTPQGLESGMRLLRFYISHSSKRLSPSRLRKLEKAQKLLAARMDRELKRQQAA